MEPIREYYATAFYSKQDAAVLGPEIERLAWERRGEVDAADVLEAAQAETSPFHKHFTWDRDRAAQQWRLEEARHILNHIRFRVVTAEGRVETDRPVVMHVREGLQQRAPDDGEEPAAAPLVRRAAYVLVDVIRQKPDLAEQAIQDAVQMLLIYRRRLEERKELLLPRYPSLQKVLDGMDEFAEEAAEGKKEPATAGYSPSGACPIQA